MAITIFFFFLFSISLCYSLKKIWGVKKSFAPTCWPIIGMMACIFKNFHRPHDFITEVLQECGGTFTFIGPCSWNIDMAFTCDPSNIHYILSKNFSNYPKGPEFRKIFDILGDGIFNADAQLWEIHRKITMSLLNHVNFQTTLEEILVEKIERGLIPVLDRFSDRESSSTDLQDIFQRFTFDSFCRLLLDYDPYSLSTDLPDLPYQKALNDVMDALLYRHIVPESCWKFLKWVGIGTEKILSRSTWVDIDEQFVYPCLRSKQEKLRNRKTGNSGDDDRLDCLTALMEAYQRDVGAGDGNSNLFLIRDVLMNLMFAGRDTISITLSWLFWLLTKNPSVETKIRKEIENEIKDSKNSRYIFNVKVSSKFVYLHGALREALRLYPPVPWQHKSPVKSDVLPSGLGIDANSKVILSFYAMGRMESIWGKDCMEFKPERWISERGGIKHEPSFKFPAFNAGPRTCLGKEMAFVQMKMVAATVIHNYQIQAVEGHPIEPSSSILLKMKHGFPVKLSKRN